MMKMNFKKVYPDINVKKLAKKDESYIERVLRRYMLFQNELEDVNSQDNFPTRYDYIEEKERVEKNIYKILEAESRKRGSYVKPAPKETADEIYERLLQEKRKRWLQ